MRKYKYYKKIGDQWLPSDIRFIRKNDIWKIVYQDGSDVILKAASDAFIKESNGEWDVKIVRDFKE